MAGDRSDREAQRLLGLERGLPRGSRQCRSPGFRRPPPAGVDKIIATRDAFARTLAEWQKDTCHSWTGRSPALSKLKRPDSADTIVLRDVTKIRTAARTVIKAEHDPGPRSPGSGRGRRTPGGRSPLRRRAGFEQNLRAGLARTRDRRAESSVRSPTPRTRRIRTRRTPMQRGVGDEGVPRSREDPGRDAVSRRDLWPAHAPHIPTLGRSQLRRSQTPPPPPTRWRR